METDRQPTTELDALIRAELSAGVDAGAERCPDAGLLAAYGDGGLSAGERLALEPHLASCSRCQAILAIAAADVSGTGAAVVPTPANAGAHGLSRNRWLPRLKWLLPLGAAACAAMLYVAVGPMRSVESPQPAARSADVSVARDVQAAAPPEVSRSTPAAPAARATEDASPAASVEPKTRRSETKAPELEPRPPADADLSRPSFTQHSADNVVPAAGRPVVTLPAGVPTLEEAAVAAPPAVVLSARAAAPSAKGALLTTDVQVDDTFARADVVVLATAGSTEGGRVPFEVVEVFKHPAGLIPASRISVDRAATTAGQHERYVLFLRVVDSGDRPWFESVGAASVLKITPADPPLVARLRQLAGTTRR